MCDLYLWYLTLGAQHTPAHTQLSPDTAQWFSATRVRDEKERNETGDGDRCATATVCCEDTLVSVEPSRRVGLRSSAWGGSHREQVERC